MTFSSACRVKVQGDRCKGESELFFRHSLIFYVHVDHNSTRDFVLLV